MIWVHLAMAVCQLILVGLIFRWGNRFDQWGAGVFLVVAGGGLVASYLQMPNIIQIAFWMAVVLFFAMWALAERARRWWMIGMAGCQVMSLMTFLAPTYSWSRLREGFVLFHWMLGVLCLACLGLALVEIFWSRRLGEHGRGAQSSDGADVDPGYSA